MVLRGPTWDPLYGAPISESLRVLEKEGRKIHVTTGKWCQCQGKLYKKIPLISYGAQTAVVNSK